MRSIKNYLTAFRVAMELLAEVDLDAYENSEVDPDDLINYNSLQDEYDLTDEETKELKTRIKNIFENSIRDANK